MNLLGKACDKNFWKEVREKDCYAFFRDETEKVWLENGESDILALKYSEFKLFFTTGDRKIYEKSYFTRRLALDSAAILAMIYPEEEKYVTKLMDLIFAICDEYTWCLPAHQGQNEHNDNAHIDLFAAETAFTLAEIYTLLSDRLDPIIKSRIETEIKRRVFDSYEAEDPYKHWEHWTNNWVAVCTASIAGAYMLMQPERVKELLPRFERAMARFLSGYKDDGVCEEGSAYWRYGFGFFTVYADMIKTFTEGEIDYFKSEKIRRISTFEQKIFLTGTASVSFSDSAPSMRYLLGLNHYLKDKYPDDVAVYDVSGAYVADHCGRFCLHLRSATWFNEKYLNNPETKAVEAEYYLKNSEWLVKKNANYSFAAKGGNNNEFHNHNDVGCFIFAKNGEQIITDPGGGLYTKNYFDNEKRYLTFEATSAAHSVPIINGTLQKHGGEYLACGMKFENNVLSYDISAAYGIDELKSLVRSYRFENDHVVLCDEFEYSGNGEIIDRIVSFKAPEVQGDRIIIGDAEIYDFDGADFTVSERDVRHGTIYLIDFIVPFGTKKFECKIK